MSKLVAGTGLVAAFSAVFWGLNVHLIDRAAQQVERVSLDVINVWQRQSIKLQPIVSERSGNYVTQVYRLSLLDKRTGEVKTFYADHLVKIGPFGYRIDGELFFPERQGLNDLLQSFLIPMVAKTSSSQSSRSAQSHRADEEVFTLTDEQLLYTYTSFDKQLDMVGHFQLNGSLFAEPAKVDFSVSGHPDRLNAELNWPQSTIILDKLTLDWQAMSVSLALQAQTKQVTLQMTDFELKRSDRRNPLQARMGDVRLVSTVQSQPDAVDLNNDWQLTKVQWRSPDLELEEASAQWIATMKGADRAFFTQFAHVLQLPDKERKIALERLVMRGFWLENELTVNDSIMSGALTIMPSDYHKRMSATQRAALIDKNLSIHYDIALDPTLAKEVKLSSKFLAKYFSEQDGVYYSQFALEQGKATLNERPIK